MKALSSNKQIAAVQVTLSVSAESWKPSCVLPFSSLRFFFSISFSGSFLIALTLVPKSCRVPAESKSECSLWKQVLLIDIVFQRKCHQSSEAVRTGLCIRCFSNQDQSNVFDLWHPYMDEETSKHLICLIVIRVLICASFLRFRGGMNVFFFLKCCLMLEGNCFSCLCVCFFVFVFLNETKTIRWSDSVLIFF